MECLPGCVIPEQPDGARSSSDFLDLSVCLWVLRKPKKCFGVKAQIEVIDL